MDEASERFIDRFDESGGSADALEVALEVRKATIANARWKMDEAALAVRLAGLESSVLQKLAANEKGTLELAIACGCAAGEANAFKAFEDEYASVIHGALRSYGRGSAFSEDVAQEVWRKLLVADEGGLPLLRYAGQGKLHGLIKVSATRTAISMLRKGSREDVNVSRPPSIADDASFPLPGFDRELRAKFSKALESEIRSLDSHERNLLRMHFLGRVTLEKLAEMYGVHRATIVRRIAGVREKLADGTKRALAESLGADPRKMETIVEALGKHLDLSLDRMLQTIDIKSDR